MKRKVLQLLASAGAAACLLGLLLLAKPAPKAEINLFSCGLLPVREKKLWGYVNTAGEMVIPPQFQKALRFGTAGRAVVWTTGTHGTDSQCAMINTSGEYVIAPGKYQDLRGIGLADRVAAMSGDSWGILDMDMNWIAEPQFKTLGSLSENGLMVAQSKQGQYGYVDRNGEWVIPPQYDYALFFGESDRAVVQVDGLYGAINKKGKLVIDPVFEYMTPFDNRGMAEVRNESGVGYVNRNGKWVIPPEFREIGSFDDLDACWASKDMKNYGIIDRRGRWVVAPTYKNLRKFIGGYTLVTTYLDEYGNLHEGSLLNEKGQVVLGPILGLGATLDGEMVWFKENGKIGYMNLKGEAVIPPQFEGHLAISENPTVGTVFFCDGYAVVRQNGNYGVIDREGNWVLEPKCRYTDILKPNY